jgi:shikimate kinase
VHVVLVGMMGSGKSTVGKRLAARLDRPFVDADHALEQALGRSISEVFATEGEAWFREEEARLLASLLAAPVPQVVAAGGGAVLRPETRERLRRDDVTVIWLRAAPAFLASRAEAKPHRPLLAEGASAIEVFERMDAERRDLYAEVADLTIDVRPFHAEEAKPKAAMAEAIAAQVVARERALEGSPP